MKVSMAVPPLLVQRESLVRNAIPANGDSPQQETPSRKVNFVGAALHGRTGNVLRHRVRKTILRLKVKMSAQDGLSLAQVKKLQASRA